MNIALFGNNYQKERRPDIEHVVDTLADLGENVFVAPELREYLRAYEYPRLALLSDYEERAEIDFAFSLGGDGTFLGTATRLAGKEIPIVGINMGRLGFLADVAVDSLLPSMRMLHAGDYVVERHSMLQVEVVGESLSTSPFALNDVAVLKNDSSSTIEISTTVNGELLTNYVADGLVICTPTGSTGYNLSVGGPILVPSSQSFCLSPVAPHSLNVRPVVLRDDVEIALAVSSRSGSFLLAVDGRSESFKDDVRILLRKAPFCTKVVKIQRQHFFDTLRDKMMWGADQRKS